MRMFLCAWRAPCRVGRLDVLFCFFQTGRHVVCTEYRTYCTHCAVARVDQALGPRESKTRTVRNLLYVPVRSLRRRSFFLQQPGCETRTIQEFFKLKSPMAVTMAMTSDTPTKTPSSAPTNHWKSILSANFHNYRAHGLRKVNISSQFTPRWTGRSRTLHSTSSSCRCSCSHPRRQTTQCTPGWQRGRLSCRTAKSFVAQHQTVVCYSWCSIRRIAMQWPRGFVNIQVYCDWWMSWAKSRKWFVSCHY